jgi:16S rRNA processing protein RimM
MEISECYKVGYILRPHGLKGEVTVALDDDLSQDFTPGRGIFLQLGHQLVPYFIQTASVKGGKAFIKFEDVDAIEAAQGISKKAIYLPKSERPKSGRGEFYDDELTGFVVEDTAHGELGKIQDVMAAGPNRLFVLDHDGKEVLIPVNSPFVRSINKSKRRITVQLPDGFLDI